MARSDSSDGNCFTIVAIFALAGVGFLMLSGGGSGSIEAVASELTGNRCASDLPPFMLSVEGGVGTIARNRGASIPCFPEGSALVAVRGAAASPYDVDAAAGADTVTLGADVSGVVVSGDCYELRAGDEVIGLASSGSFAQFAVVECAKVGVRPVNENNVVSLKDMSALPTNAGSAYELLVAAGAPWTTSPTVLIGSGASRTGVYAVQLAKALGAGKVIAVEPWESAQADLLTSLGADQIVDDASAAGSVDVALNNGAAADFAPALNSAGVSVTLGTDDAELTSTTFAKLITLTDKGALKPVIYDSYTWTEMDAAIAAMPSAAGSIVLDVVMPVCGVMQAHWGAEGRICPAYGQHRICTGTVGGGPAYDGMGGIAIAGGGLCMCGGRCWDALKGTPESLLTFSDRAVCPMSASANCIYA